MAMTRLKKILRVNCNVFTVDWMDTQAQAATCPSEEKAEWVAWSLGQCHGVPVEHIDE